MERDRGRVLGRELRGLKVMISEATASDLFVGDLLRLLLCPDEQGVDARELGSEEVGGLLPPENAIPAIVFLDVARRLAAEGVL